MPADRNRVPIALDISKSEAAKAALQPGRAQTKNLTEEKGQPL